MSACIACGHEGEAAFNVKVGAETCVDKVACKERLLASLRPPRDMTDPRLKGLPEIAQDAIVRCGDPLLMVNGGSLNLSDLCRICVAEGCADD
jgi:hypothetical protein